MPDTEYVEIEHECDNHAGNNEQPMATGQQLPLADHGSGITRAILRRWLYLVLLCCAGAMVLTILLPWWQHQRHYRRPTSRLALQRSIFLCDPRLGTVADMKRGHFHSGMGEEIAVVGADAVFYTDFSGRLHSRVDFSMPGDGTRLVPAGEHHAFLQPGITNRLAVMDQSGKVRWAMGGNSHTGRYAAGDLYGDGHTEFAVGWLTQHGGCLRLLDENGQLLWERPDPEAFFRNYAVVDVWQDGHHEIMYPERDRLVLLDSQGQTTGIIRLPFSLENYTLCPWPSAASAPVILTTHQNLLWFIGFDGRLLAQRYLPDDYYDSASFYASPVKLRAGEPPYFAVVLNNGQGRLLLYDPHGAIVHEEKLSVECSALFAIPSKHNLQTQDLLLCSEGMAWRLAAGKVRPIRWFELF